MPALVAVLRGVNAPRGTPARHAKNIAAAISTQLKLEVPVIAKSANELAAILSENPVKARADEHPRLLVAFVQVARRAW